jgi:outer membrane protein
MTAQDRSLTLSVRLICAVLLVMPAPAQDQRVVIEKPHLPSLLRPYAAPGVPASRPGNSKRLHELMRAGKLYLTVQDALALAIENNLNLEVERYGPLLAQSALERALAGGPVRGVPSASAQVSSVNSGVGVNGSVQSAGLSSGGGGGNGGTAGAATIQQVGAITPNLDPVLQNTTVFSHLSQPQDNTVVSQTNALIQSIHTYNTVLQEGLITGGVVQFRDYEGYLKENAPTDILNPAVGPHMDLSIRHSLLQGFGVNLNNRFIRIAKVNTVGARESFRSQLLDLTANVLNLYWDLVSYNDELKIRRSALETSQKFYQDTQKEVAAGAMPAVQLPRAKAEADVRRQDVVIAEYNVRQRESLLKDALIRAQDPEVEVAEIVTLDRIQVPDTEDLPPLRQLLATAMEKRPDVAVAKYREQTSEMSLVGTTSPLLPNLQVQAQTYNRGAAGSPQIVDGQGPDPYFVGGYGTALKQVLRRDYPSEQGALNFSASIGNRQAQGDYGIDQLQFRQSQLSRQRDINQIAVDISNQLSALRQSRSRYTAAKQTRALQEEILSEDRKKFSYGIATFNDIIADQRALTTAQISELGAATAYAHARVSLDQVSGESLEKNHVSLDEGLRGVVSSPAKLP